MSQSAASPGRKLWRRCRTCSGLLWRGKGRNWCREESEVSFIGPRASEAACRLRPSICEIVGQFCQQLQGASHGSVFFPQVLGQPDCLTVSRTKNASCAHGGLQNGDTWATYDNMGMKKSRLQNRYSGMTGGMIAIGGWLFWGRDLLCKPDPCPIQGYPIPAR
jgi:hypothetical protein